MDGKSKVFHKQIGQQAVETKII